MVQRRSEDSDRRCCPPRIPRKYYPIGLTIAQVTHGYGPQRQVYHKDSSDTFWKTVDKTLADVRLKASKPDSPSVSKSVLSPPPLSTYLTLNSILVKCLDSDELRYPASSTTASARAALASVWQSETQSSMDVFVAASESAASR